MPDCSLRKRILYVLLALMLLPVVSAFAWNSTIKVTVLDNLNAPVSDAEVIVWDLNNIYIKGSGTTDSAGNASIDIYTNFTADSFTNPSDNIAILAIPSATNNPNNLAFGKTTTLFPGMPDRDSSMTNPTVLTLQPGCQLTVNPKLSENGVISSGVVGGLTIELPEVNYSVKSFVIYTGSINASNPSWKICWPKNTSVKWTLNGSYDQNDITKSGYYGEKSGSFEVGDELTKDKELVHVREEKGRLDFAGETGHTYTIKYYESAYSQRLSNYYTLTTVESTGTVYLPYNNYSFYSIEKVATVGNPPIQIFTPVTIGSTTATLNLAAQPGSSVTGHVSLAGNSSLNACDHISVVAELKIGESMWFEVEEVTPSTVDGSYAFTHQLANGSDYRIKTGDRYNYYSPGVIDDSTDPKQCYTNLVYDLAALEGNKVVDLVLPQAAALSFKITYPAGWQLVNQQIGTVPVPDVNGTRYIQNYSGEIFVSFVDPKQPFFARFDCDSDPYSTVDAPYIKISQPQLPEAGKTTVINVNVDPAAFALVTSNLYVGPDAAAKKQYLDGDVSVWMNPVLTFAGKNYSLTELMYLPNRGVDNKIFNSDDQDPFIFRAEKNMTYRLEAVENFDALPVRPLCGFLPYSQDFKVADAAEMSNDILLAEGRSFYGRINDDAGPKVGASVGVRLTSIYNEYTPNFENITRYGQVTLDSEGRFRVAGVNSGRYRVELILDRLPDNLTRYTSQGMPIMTREIFIAEDADTAIASPTTIDFNLKVSEIGWLDCKVADESGNAIAGARAEVRNNNGEVVFYCSTNDDGMLKTPKYDQIPLENGAYNVFVVGIATEPASFTYNYNYHSPASVQIYPNQQVTSAVIKLARAFPVYGILKEGSTAEDAQPVQYAQIRFEDSRGVQSYVMSDDVGKYGFLGLLPGDYRYFVEIYNDGAVKLYSGSVTVNADQENLKDLVLLSSAQKQVVIQARIGDQPLANAGGRIILFSNATLRFKAAHWYIASPWAGSDGKITISLPPLTQAEIDAGYAYGFQGYERAEYVTDPETGVGYHKSYTPPALTIIDLASSVPLNLTWKAPVSVTVQAANVPTEPADRADKYLGVLMTNARFVAGRDGKLPGEQDGQEYNRDKFFAVLNSENKFVFNNIPTDQEYVFLAYEANDVISPEMVQYAWDFPTTAIFRHASLPFAVAADLVRSETLLPLATLKLSCQQDSTVFTRPQALQMFFTGNAANTIGNTGWSVINGIYNNYEFIRPEIQVPAGYALRLVYKPEVGAQFLPRIVENFVVPAIGREFELLLGEQAKVSGVVTFKGQPVDGQLVLVPDGANPLGENFVPHRIQVMAGSFKDYLNPGYYMGYAVPFTGGPAKFIELTMASTSQTLPPISIDDGVPVRGRVVTGSTVFGVSVMVLRKKSPRSDIADGQQFYPYPVMGGISQIPCGPMGDFYFVAEKNVDYYLQTIVPAGFTPAKMEKISVVDQEVIKDLSVGVGATIKGSMNVAGWAEAVPVGTSAEAGQVGMPTSFYAQADMLAGERYPFTFVGLDPAMLYNITFWPMDGSKSYKKLTNIPVPQTNLEVNLGDGFKITGQLRDLDGNPLYVANVPVNLAMTMPAMTIDNATWTTMPTYPPTDPTYPPISTMTPPVGTFTPPVPPATMTVPVLPNSYYSIRQNVRALDTTSMPASFSFENAMTTGMWAQTNELGQFTFNNVPDFLLAFIKTEKGFAVDGVSYGVARTETFVPGFVDGLMTVDLKVPVGGRIIGRVIDDTGKPVPSGWVEAFMGQNYSEANTSSDGNFTIDGLAPGSGYMFSLGAMPGYAPISRSGLLVEPGKTTDLGTIVVSRAVYAFGIATGSRALKERSFRYGMQEDAGVSIVALDGTRALTDEDLLSGKYAQSMFGDADFYLADSDTIGFGMQVKPGKISAGVVLWRDSTSGFETMVSWGWKTGLVVPTQDQLGTGTFEISTEDAPIVFPQKFGNIEGTIKHASDTAVMFNPEDAIVALYPASGTTIMVTPFPAAMTRAINGNWFIRDVPAGHYMVKVITRKYGIVIEKAAIDIVDNATARKDIVLNSAVKKITGRVVMASDKSKVASAKVALILKNLSTTTNSEGVFEFYLPESDLFIPQLEISKPGIKTTRIASLSTAAGEIASKGITLTSDLQLNDVEVSGSVGSVEVVVKSSKDNKIYIGAEVALVYQDPGSAIWTIGETQITNENGVARFLSVPLNTEVRFRARAHYHNPKTETLAASANTGQVIVNITMEQSKPKVFYTGIAELDVNDPTKVKVSASFDFDQVVATSAVNLYINDISEIARCKYPDLIGSRFTYMTFNGLVAAPAEGGSLVASVTHLDSQIGSFSLMTRAVFRKEYAVDPLAQDGFTGRQTDATGNILPTGISVPPGYLDPEIQTFKLEVASPTVEQQAAKIEDAAPEAVVKIAGPVFSFTFGEGDSHAGGDVASSTGLFEITIAYEEGTNLEPRWYDSTHNVWSKVGIIEGSVNKDYPQPGYVTFKVSHLTDFVIMANDTSAKGKSGDLNDDGFCNMADIAIYMAWFMKGGTDNKDTVKTLAESLYPAGKPFNIVYLPSSSVDDFNNDKVCNMSDIAYFMAWFLKGGTSVKDTINTQALSLYGNLVGSVDRIPGIEVTR